MLIQALTLRIWAGRGTVLGKASLRQVVPRSHELFQVERLLAPELLRWRRHPSLALEALKEILGSELF